MSGPEPLRVVLDVGGSAIKSGRVRSRRVEGFRRDPYDAQGTAEEILTAYREVIRRHLDAADAHVAEVVLAHPGPFDYERGIMDYQIGRAVFVAVAQDEVERLRSLPKVAPTAAPQDAGRPPRRLLHWVEWGCWFTLLFGIYLFAKGDANQAQFAFRLALLGGGLSGVIVFLIVRLVRASS